MDFITTSADGKYGVRKVENVTNGFAIVRVSDSLIERFVSGKQAAACWIWGYETAMWENEKKS